MIEQIAASVESRPIFNPVLKQVTSGHLSQILENDFKLRRDESQHRTSERWFRLFYVMLGIGIFVFLTLTLLPDHSDLFFKLVQGVGIFSAGFAGGYGVKTYQDRRQR